MCIPIGTQPKNGYKECGNDAQAPFSHSLCFSLRIFGSRCNVLLILNFSGSHILVIYKSLQRLIKGNNQYSRDNKLW